MVTLFIFILYSAFCQNWTETILFSVEKYHVKSGWYLEISEFKKESCAFINKRYLYYNNNSLHLAYSKPLNVDSLEINAIEVGYNILTLSLVNSPEVYIVDLNYNIIYLIPEILSNKSLLTDEEVRPYDYFYAFSFDSSLFVAKVPTWPDLDNEVYLLRYVYNESTMVAIDSLIIHNNIFLKTDRVITEYIEYSSKDKNINPSLFCHDSVYSSFINYENWWKIGSFVIDSKYFANGITSNLVFGNVGDGIKIIDSEFNLLYEELPKHNKYYFILNNIKGK